MEKEDLVIINKARGEMLSALGQSCEILKVAEGDRFYKFSPESLKILLDVLYTAGKFEGALSTKGQLKEAEEIKDTVDDIMNTIE